MAAKPDVTSPERPLIDLRELGAILALAILMPLAVSAAVVTMSWGVVTLITGQPYPAGNDLSDGIAAALLALARYVTVGALWTWLAVGHGKRWWWGVLAALPIIGIVWAIRLSALVVRSGRAEARLSRRLRGVLTAIVSLALVALPMGIATATSAADREEARLAAPCLPDEEQATIDDAVAVVSGVPISRGELEGWASEVSERRVGPVAKRDTRLPAEVLQTAIQIRLWERLAARDGITLTVGDAEADREASEAREGGAEEYLDLIASWGIPASQAARWSCASAAIDAVRAKYGEEIPERLTDAIEDQVADVPQEFGYWSDEEFVLVPTAPDEPAVSKDAPRTFASKVTYEVDSIPDQEFPDTLDWQADLCVAAADLLTPAVAARVSLWERVGTTWVKVDGAKAVAKEGGRCDGGSVNLTIGTTAPEPPVNWTDKGWTTCRRYEVRLPEMRAFRATSVELCVATEASTGKGA